MSHERITRDPTTMDCGSTEESIETAMTATAINVMQPDYFTAYRSLKLTRDAQGVLVAEFHSNSKPLTFTAQDHTDFVDAFYRIAQDRANKIVILTGTGGEFIPGIDFASFGNVADPDVWSQVHDEGVQILENLANIRVPMTRWTSLLSARPVQRPDRRLLSREAGWAQAKLL